MSDATIVITILGAFGVVLFAVGARLSEALLRFRARRLPLAIALRMEEEWLGELGAIASRPGKLAFAIALTLTRRQAFAAPGEDSMSEIVKDSRLGPQSVFSGRKALLIFSTLIFALAAYGASFLLPVRYASDSLILVSGDPVEERLKSIEQTVMSRTNLIAILREIPQLKNGRETLTMDRSIEELRKDIALSFDPSSGGPSPVAYFRLRYAGPNSELAQKVTSKLTQSFIKLDFAKREAQVFGTRDFLRQQLGVLAGRVTKKGDELARERAAHGPQSGRILEIEYEQLVANYKAAFAKLEDAEMGSEQKGGQVAVVDPANLGTPVAPNRLAFAGLGAFVGLALGGMAVVSRDRRRRRALAQAHSAGL